MAIDGAALRSELAREFRELHAEISADRLALRGKEDDGRQVALQLRESQLRKIEHALERHDAGTWRECEDCGRPLTDDQFRTLATVTHCTDCATDHVYWGDTRVIDKDELGL